MASMPQDPPLWLQALDAAVKFFTLAELKIEEARVQVSEIVRDIAEGALNFTTTALQHLARPLLHFHNRSSFKTFLLAPGCDVISPSCIVRQCNTSEDLRAVMPIAAGPYEFDTTTSYVNIDAWSFPVFYVYNPNYFDNYTRGLGDDHDDIFKESTKTAYRRAEPVFRYPALPSADKALAVLSSGAGLRNGNIIPVGVLAFFYILVVFCGLYHFGVLPLGRYIGRKYNTYTKTNQDAYATLAGAANCDDEESHIERAYVVTLNNLSANVDRKHADLQQSESERASLQSQLLECTSVKVDVEKQLRDCTSQKKAVESNLRKCESDKESVEKTLNEMASAQIETVQKVNALENDLTEAEAAQREAKKEVSSAEEAAEKKIKVAEQKAEKKVKQALADANKEVTEANNKVKQAKDEADKAKSAQKEAEDKVESNQQESRKNFASAQQEAKEKLDSAQREARELFDSAEQEAKKKFESAQQDANQAAKLAKENAKKNIKSVEKIAEMKLNNTTATYEQHKKQLQDELSTAKTTIEELQPYKDNASRLSEEVDRLQNDLDLKQEEYRGEVNDLSNKYDDKVIALRREHDNAIEDVHQERRGELHRLREQQGVSMKELKQKHGNEVQELKGKLEEYVEMQSELGGAKRAKDDAEEEVKSVRQQLGQAIRDNELLKTKELKISNEKKTLQSQLQDAREDNEKFKAEKVKLSDANNTLQAQLQKIMNEKQAGSEEFDLEKNSLQEQLQSTQTQLKTATTQFEADQKRLQEKLQDVQAQLETVTTQHQTTKKSLQAQVEQAKESMPRLEAANTELSQEVGRLQEQTKSQAESIVSKDDRIHHLQSTKDELLGLKERATTELPAMKSALEKAERSDKEIKQDLETTADHKKKRRNRRKHRNGRYSTDRPDDTKYNESDTESEDLPAAQTAQHTVQQPLESPVEAQVEELREGLSNLAFDDDTATRDARIVRQAAKTDASASDTGSSSNGISSRFLPDAASFVPAEEAQLAMPGFSKQSEASSTPAKSEVTRAEITRAEGRTDTPRVVKEGVTELGWRSSPGSSSKSEINVSGTSTLVREVEEREEAHTATPISTPYEGLPKKDEAAAAKQDPQLVVNTSIISHIDAEKTDGNVRPGMNDSASSSRVESESAPVSAPVATISCTAAQPSTTKASQRVNAEPTTPTADVKLHEPKSGRPDFVTEELAAQRAEDLKKSKWATHTAVTTKSSSGQSSANRKSAQIFKSCIDDAKGKKPRHDLQESRWASVVSEVKPVGPTAKPSPQIVPSTTLSGRRSTSATAASNGMPPAIPSVTPKSPGPADTALVALASATLPPVASNPVFAFIMGASAATASTATAPNTVASVPVAGSVRASQYSSSAHAAAARSSNIPQRGRGTGMGSGRGRGGRGGGGRGRGTGGGLMQNHDLPDWLAEDLARQAAEAQSSATTPRHTPSTADHPPTAVTTATSAPEGPSKSVDQRTASSTSSVQGLKAETKTELANSRLATNTDSATSSRPVPNSQIGSGSLQSKHATKPEIKHQLFESKYATNSRSSNDNMTTSKPKVKNDLLQSKYATND